MSVAVKINDIRDIYHQVRSHGDKGGPDVNDQKAGPVPPVDRVSLSREALSQHRQESGESPLSRGEEALSPDEKQAVQKMKQRDAEVKAHEAAHMASGGGVVQGGASYEYQSGPDGKMYAVGGEVQIDTSSAGSPEATIRKMQQIKRAALAPAQPSGTDRAVAAQASQIEAMARMEKNQEEETSNDQTPSAYALDRTSRDRTEAEHLPMGSRIDFLV